MSGKDSSVCQLLLLIARRLFNNLTIFVNLILFIENFQVSYISHRLNELSSYLNLLLDNLHKNEYLYLKNLKLQLITIEIEVDTITEHLTIVDLSNKSIHTKQIKMHTFTFPSTKIYTYCCLKIN